ncbi:MAG: tail fiber domain-containing protein, partial [Bacteroidota bacterium]
AAATLIEGVESERNFIGSYLATSTTSITIGTGSKTFATLAGLAYSSYSRVRISNSSSNFMEGLITSYTGTSLVVNVDYVSGSGTFASWNISIAGIVGTNGTTGASGTTGTTGAQGIQGVAGATGASGADGAANAWSLTGNAGIVDGINFIGTTNNASLTFKANNIVSGKINLINGGTSFGYNSLSNNTTGTYNTSFGYNALQNNTTGTENTAIGYKTLSLITNGYRNTALGIYALSDDSTGNYNIAIGGASLSDNISGDGNIAIGNEAMTNNKTAGQNVAIGWNALRLQSYDAGGYKWNSNNVAIGDGALFSNQPTSTLNGIENTAVGFYSLNDNTTGAYNTASGAYSLYLNITGNNNASFGNNSLHSNSSGSNNVALGNYALYSNVAGSNATAIGYNAMYYANSSSNSFLNCNVALGYQALQGSSQTSNTGNYNTALGYQTLLVNSTGGANVAGGYQSLFSNTTGNNNTACGTYSLNSNSTGYYNTAVGSSALTNTINGYYNTAIGMSAYPSNTAIVNYTGIGYNVGSATSVNNSVELGNTSVGSIKGQVALTTYSDERIKDNIKANVPGLDFILKLRPVTYNLNIHKQNEIMYKDKKDANTDWDGKYDIEKITMTGFIAQEVEQASKEVGFDFSGIDKPKSNDGLYGLRYSEFVVPLVKAVQEQQEQITQLKKLVELQQKQIEELLKK